MGDAAVGDWGEWEREVRCAHLGKGQDLMLLSFVIPLRASIHMFNARRNAALRLSGYLDKTSERSYSLKDKN